MGQLSSYFDRGWVVLPVPAGKKKINIPWKQFQNDPQAAEKSRVWFGKNPDLACNYAIMTGETSRVLIIDLDPAHMDIDMWEFFAKYPTDLVQKTPRGGLHLYFRYPEGLHLGNSRGDLPKGIDVRGQGGYALLAPSTVTYDDGFTGAYEWHSFGEPAELPQELIEIIQRPKSSDEHPTRTENQTKLERILSGEFTEGEHNEEILWAAGYLCSRGMPEAAIYQLLLIADSKDPTPQGPEQVRATTAQAIRYYNEREQASYEFGYKQPDTAQTSKVSNKPGLGVMTFARYAHEYQAETRFLVDKWVPLNALLMMTAAPETGKTWFMFDMAVAVSLGNILDPDGFLGGYRTYWPTPQNVLIIQQEDQPGKITQRIEAIYNAHIRRAGNQMRVWVDDAGEFHMHSIYDLPGKIYMLPGSDFRFDEPGAMDRLEQTIKDLDVRLVLIDPLYKLAATEDYLASFKDHFGRLKEIRNKHNVTVIIAHHTKKTNEGGRGAAWGSVFLDASSEGQITLFADPKKADDDGSKFLMVTCSGKGFDEAFSTEGWLRLSTVAGEEKVLLENYDIQAELGGSPHNLKVFQTLQMGEMTQAELARETGLHATQVKRALEALMKLEKVTQHDKAYRAVGYEGLF